MTFAFEGQDREKPNLVRIRLQSTTNLITPEDAKAAIEIKEQSGSGFILFDTEQGNLSESRIQLAMEILTKQGEKESSVSLNSATRIKVSRVDDAVATAKDATTQATDPSK